MGKSVHYLLLLMVLIVPTGCETVHGAARFLQRCTQLNGSG